MTCGGCHDSLGGNQQLAGLTQSRGRGHEREGKLKRDSGWGMRVAGGWAGVGVRVKVELRVPPGSWGTSQLASSAAVFACLPGLLWGFLLLQ